MRQGVLRKTTKTFDFSSSTLTIQAQLRVLTERVCRHTIGKAAEAIDIVLALVTFSCPSR
jgi:hypothetical protein